MFVTLFSRPRHKDFPLRGLWPSIVKFVFRALDTFEPSRF